MGVRWGFEQKEGKVESLEASPKEERKIAQIRKQLRKRILGIVLLVVAILSALLILLSLPNVQNVLFPARLIEIWPQIIAASVVVMIASVITLPVVIEANMNPRVLSGPGDADIPV
jgi:hypothetical protein